MIYQNGGPCARLAFGFEFLCGTHDIGSQCMSNILGSRFDASCCGFGVSCCGFGSDYCKFNVVIANGWKCGDCADVGSWSVKDDV